MFAYLATLIKSQKGQDLAEYALLLALIAIVVIVAVALLGPQISAVFQNISDALGANGFP
jgi:pilus assembly protein Flp/PilA